MPPDERPKRVRLLYRELNPENGSSTLSRFATTLSPLIVLFQHWAVKVEEGEKTYWFELQYNADRSGLVETRLKGESIEERVSYKADGSEPVKTPLEGSYREFPYGHRHLWGGKTSKPIDEIRRIAQRLINGIYSVYVLGVFDCRGFALALLYRIVKWKNPGLILNKAVDMLVLKPLLMPISAFVTAGLAKWGSIRDRKGVKTEFRKRLMDIFRHYRTLGGELSRLKETFRHCLTLGGELSRLEETFRHCLTLGGELSPYTVCSPITNLIQNTNHAYSIKQSGRATSSNASSTPRISTPSQSGSQGGQSPPQAGGSNGSEAQWVRTSSNVPGQQWAWWDGTKYTGQYW